MDVRPLNMVSMGIEQPVFSAGGTDFSASNAVILQQKTNMHCRCWCCQPNIDFKMQDYAADTYTPGSEIEETWTITEDAAFLGRCISLSFPGARPTSWTVHSQSGETVMSHEKGLTCAPCGMAVFFPLGQPWPLPCPCCCCLPYMDTFDERHNKLGSTKYVCDQNFFVPKFDVLDVNDRRIARIRPDVCCLGCCVQFRRKDQTQKGQRSRGHCRVPFVVRQPEEPFEPIMAATGQTASISDLWVAAECCRKREVFAITFPPAQHFMGNDLSAMKKILIGSTMLVQMSMFEQEGL